MFLKLRNKWFKTEVVQLKGRFGGLYRPNLPKSSGGQVYVKPKRGYNAILWESGKYELYWGGLPTWTGGTWEPYTYRESLELNKPAKRKEQLRRTLSNIRRVLGAGHGITWLYTMTEVLGALGVIIIAVELMSLLVYLVRLLVMEIRLDRMLG
jgi:hypothetical protein